MTDPQPQKIQFTTEIQGIEVEVSIDCQRIVQEWGKRAVRNSNGRAAGAFGAIRVRRIKQK